MSNAIPNGFHTITPHLVCAGAGEAMDSEEALHDAFRAALEQWPRDGLPANPRAWLISTRRFKAIDGLRRPARFEALDEETHPVDPASMDEAAFEEDEQERE
jgi:RNA polymerase sigma-70 factor, ECF subfamily